MADFILASASPRRKEILYNAGFSFEIIPSDADENISEALTDEETVKELAKRKAKFILDRYPDRIVFGCDTVVAIDGRILGKPENAEDAFRMLKMLSGKTHRVSTGVCVMSAEKELCFSDATEVVFYELSDETIRSYIATGECCDKAGAYGIQGYGCVLVKEIKGDYFSVMGLPVAKAARALGEFGIIGKVEL
ncbi:MAG: septum formation inhibitor Maf [Clostridia bacterium]|nr:septum formation inhibitor Maf [Clostridia bacterium]